VTYSPDVQVPDRSETRHQPDLYFSLEKIKYLQLHVHFGRGLHDAERPERGIGLASDSRERLACTRRLPRGTHAWLVRYLSMMLLLAGQGSKRNGRSK